MNIYSPFRHKTFSIFEMLKLRLPIIAFTTLLASTAFPQHKTTDTTITKSPPNPTMRDTTLHMTKKPQPIIGITKVLEYPADAKKAGIEGTVVVRFKVLRDCRTDSVSIVKSDNPIFNKAAIEGFKKCRYLPAMKDNHIVEVWTMERVNFTLH